MARATLVKAAQKNYPDHGIKKGESYYWWKFRYGGKHYSKTPPKQSQLTSSEFLSTVYGFDEQISEWTAKTGEDLEGLKSDRDMLVEELRQLADEQDEKRNNMPDSLQDSETGQLLEGRQQSCEEMADELDNVDLDLEREEGESTDDFNDRIEDALEELQNVSYNGE